MPDDYTLEDECTLAKVPMVKTKELNTILTYPPINFFETKDYTVVEHLQDGKDSIAVAKNTFCKINGSIETLFGKKTL